LQLVCVSARGYIESVDKEAGRAKLAPLPPAAERRQRARKRATLFTCVQAQDSGTVRQDCQVSNLSSPAEASKAAPVFALGELSRAKPRWLPVCLAGWLASCAAFGRIYIFSLRVVSRTLLLGALACSSSEWRHRRLSWPTLRRCHCYAAAGSVLVAVVVVVVVVAAAAAITCATVAMGY